MRNSITKNKKILLLGGEGFIGKNISDNLAEGYECFSLDAAKSLFSGKKCEFLTANPYRDKIDLEFDVLIHLIDNNAESFAFEQEEESLMANLIINKGTRLVIFSSAAIYADPDSEYARRKMSFESFYTRFCEKKGIDLAICRVFNSYGKYQLPLRKGSFVANVFYNYLNGVATDVSDFTAQRDFIFAGDVAKFIDKIVRENVSGIVDVGTGSLTPLGKIIGIVEKEIAQKKIIAKDLEQKDRCQCPAANNTLVPKKEMTSLENGLGIAYQFYKSNISQINAGLKQ